MHVIPDNQEIIDKAHALYGAKLIVQPLPHLRLRVRIALGEALLAELLQIFPGREAPRDIVFRDLPLAEDDLHMAAVCDPCRVVAGLRDIGEEVSHFLLALYIVLAALVAHAVLVLDLLLRLDTEEHVVRLPVLGARVVDVVRADERKARLLVHADQLLIDMALLRNSVVLELEIEMVRPEDGGEVLCRADRPLVVAHRDVPRNLAREARRERNDALVVLREDFAVDARLVVEALREAGRHDLAEVVISLRRLGEQHEVIISVVRRSRVLVKTAPRRYINLAPENRFDSLCEAFLVEIHAAVHDAVVRNGRGRHAKLLHSSDIFFYFV